jgi:hypothetical protein
MAAVKRTGPVALTTTTTTNIQQGAGGDAAMRDRIKHIHVMNKSSSPATFDLYLGASVTNAAGTELFKGHTVPANGEFDYYCDKLLASTEYLVGGANVVSALVITIEFEREVV